MGEDPPFRGHLAAASLKQHVREHCLDAALNFPRPFGRGLIEAARSFCCFIWSVPFRGHLAAASLKREGLPRHRLAAVAFRGHLAAASLKLARRDDGEYRSGPFRGHLAAASLKRCDAHATPRVVSSFPRPFGRGLIEARINRHYPNAVLLLSAAIWPRPH